ncbi:hypothetical protein BD413DRAFT_549163 [Trametes elegans]|nr:hypothetical protein BD413DRAFT_549163 [Trametes elegans]
MTSASSSTWMPTGRHEINVGSSLMRALKARKGGVVKNSKAKPDREFYSFRCMWPFSLNTTSGESFMFVRADNFKPESVDPTKPGSIEVRKPKDEAGPTSVNVVRPSTQNGNGVNYVGQERAAREYDCVLIYDEELGTFTLEKIESCVSLQHDPRTVHGPRHANSPAPAAPQRISTSTSTPTSYTHERGPITKREEEEESEGEIPEPHNTKQPSRGTEPVSHPKAKPHAPSPQQTPYPPPRAAPPSLPSKPGAAIASSKAPSAAAPPKPKPRPIPPPPSSSNPKGPNKRELPIDAEDKPEPRRVVQPPPLKKAKVVPEKKKEPVALALPGTGSSGLALPSASSASPLPPALSLPTPSSIVSLPSAPLPAPAAPVVSVTAITDSDEEDWDEVQPTPFAPPPATLPPRQIVMEEIEPSPSSPPAHAMDEAEVVDIDMAAFAEELQEQLEDPEAAEAEADEDDFLAGAMSPVAERQPVSLSQFAGGGADFGDEDDYSSSDESDDD